MKELKIWKKRMFLILSRTVHQSLTCFVSSDKRELAKLMQEQYSATQAHHFSLIISPHMLKIIPAYGKDDILSQVPNETCTRHDLVLE